MRSLSLLPRAFCPRAVLPMSRPRAARFARTWPSTLPMQERSAPSSATRPRNMSSLPATRIAPERRCCRPRPSKFRIRVIALETGVVGDPDKDVFKWDGVARSIEAWNRDHTLRTAIAASVVPVYQEIARRIGAERMQKYLDLFEYGNRDIGGGIDQFWLTGNLRIDPVQQIDFVDRLRRGVLPVSKRSQELVRDILPVTKAGDSLICAKTGLLGAEIGKPSLGWLVGWVEKGSARTVFALNVDIREQRHIADRMTLAQQYLTDIGALYRATQLISAPSLRLAAAERERPLGDVASLRPDRNGLPASV